MKIFNAIFGGCYILVSFFFLYIRFEVYLKGVIFPFQFDSKFIFLILFFVLNFTVWSSAFAPFYV